MPSGQVSSSRHPAISYSDVAAAWMTRVRYEDLPADVVSSTKLRILDIIGLMVAGSRYMYGRTARDAALALGGRAESTIVGFGDRTGAASAAIANGLMAHALEYDDTHNETLVHASVTSVTTALPLGEALHTSGVNVLTSVAAANELACRVAMVAPGAFLTNGFHPTAVVGTFAAAFLAGRLLGLDSALVRHAIGIAGSMTAGSTECWSDDTHAKALHPGWSAHAGIAAAYLARAGLTGPSRIFEGRWGFFRSHVQQSDYAFQYQRMLHALGDEWESRNLSFKPYPVGHVSHPFIEAMLYLVRQHGLRADQVRNVTCFVHPDSIPLVCEPVEEKLHPKTAWHGRISLQYTLAEAIHTGGIGIRSYADASLFNPDILGLARKVRCEADPEPPPRSQFKGWVIVDTHDGRRLERIEPFSRGSRQNPMSEDDIVAKFRDNASIALDGAQMDRIASFVLALEQCADIATLMAMCAPIDHPEN